MFAKYRAVREKNNQETEKMKAEAAEYASRKPGSGRLPTGNNRPG